MAHFCFHTAFSAKTSLLISHEAMASLHLRASSLKKIRREIKNDHTQEGSSWLS
jgi:hypothetical protein